MENVKQKVVKILEQKCGLPYDVSVYMNHVVIKIPVMMGLIFTTFAKKYRPRLWIASTEIFLAGQMIFCFASKKTDTSIFLKFISTCPDFLCYLAQTK